MGDALSAISAIAKLLLMIGEMVREHKQQGIGYAKAVQDALETAHRDLALADAERIQAVADHQDQTDAAFDQEFRRP